MGCTLQSPTTDDRQESRAAATWTARPKRDLTSSQPQRAAPAEVASTDRDRHVDKSDAYRDEDFAIDDGDEDAWVHDGIDDIHIDPETRRAASELAREESSSIDAEYEPHAAGQETSPAEGQSSGRASGRQLAAVTIAGVIPAATGGRGRAAPALLPAAYLSLGQVQALVGEAAAAGGGAEEQERRRRKRRRRRRRAGGHAPGRRGSIDGPRAGGST